MFSLSNQLAHPEPLQPLVLLCSGAVCTWYKLEETEYSKIAGFYFLALPDYEACKNSVNIVLGTPKHSQLG